MREEIFRKKITDLGGERKMMNEGAEPVGGRPRVRRLRGLS
jgi:hypothetical protein